MLPLIGGTHRTGWAEAFRRDHPLVVAGMTHAYRFFPPFVNRGGTAKDLVGTVDCNMVGGQEYWGPDIGSPGSVYRGATGVQPRLQAGIFTEVTNKITVAFSVKYHTTAPSSMVVFDGPNRDITFALGNGAGTTTTWHAYFDNSGTSATFTSKTVYPNIWTRYMVVFQPGTATVYVDGSNQGSLVNSASVSPTLTDAVYLCASSTGLNQYNGQLADFFIWNIAGDDNLAQMDYQEYLRKFTGLHPKVTPLNLLTMGAMPNAYTLTADTGMYTLDGQDATLTFQNAQWDLVVDTGMYNLTGQDVTLSYDPANAYSLTVDTGQYNLTGQDVTLRYSNFPSTLETGYYVLTGQSVDIYRTPSPDDSTEWYIGRRKRGQTVSMVVQPKDYPDAAPIIDYWLDGLTLVKSSKLPIADYNHRIFALQQYLDNDFEDGHYVAVIRYDYGIYRSQHYRYFEVIGGDAQGQVIAVHSMRRTLGQAVIRHTEDGNIKIGYDPRVE